MFLAVRRLLLNMPTMKVRMCEISFIIFHGVDPARSLRRHRRRLHFDRVRRVTEVVTQPRNVESLAWTGETSMAQMFDTHDLGNFNRPQSGDILNHDSSGGSCLAPMVDTPALGNLVRSQLVAISNVEGLDESCMSILSEVPDPGEPATSSLVEAPNLDDSDDFAGLDISPLLATPSLDDLYVLGMPPMVEPPSREDEADTEPPLPV